VEAHRTFATSLLCDQLGYSEEERYLKLHPLQYKLLLAFLLLFYASLELNDFP
jgi:hypothetical protein